MAKVSGPLLSLSASGQIAKTQVASHWKGIAYMRRYAVPANPQTAGQTMTRSVFHWLVQVWKLLGANTQAAWTLAAKGQNKTNRNIFIGLNVTALRAGDSLEDMIGSPGAKGGLPPTSIANAVAADVVTTTLGVPTLPDGWTIVKSIGFLIAEQDPHTGTKYVSSEVVNAAAPYHLVFPAQVAGTYEAYGFFEFTKSDGSTAYGASLNATAVCA